MEDGADVSTRRSSRVRLPRRKLDRAIRRRKEPALTGWDRFIVAFAKIFNGLLPRSAVKARKA
jgi:hypothetical protein